MNTNNQLSDVSQMVFERWNANHQVVWFVGDELYRYFTASQEAAKGVKERFGQNIKVICQDKAVGFYDNKPGIIIPTDKSNNPINALQILMGDQIDVKATNPNFDLAKAPFKPQDNVICIFKDWDSELQNTVVQEFIRNIIQTNMASDGYYNPEDRRVRGRRMLVFITTSKTAVPPTIPEIKPIQMSLPDEKTLDGAIENITAPLTQAYEETRGKKGLKPLSVDVRRAMISAGKGMTYQAFEDATSLAMARHRGFDNLDEVINTIEEEKSHFVANVPGLTYVPRKVIDNVTDLPGYEQLIEFVRARTMIDPDVARDHNINPVRGLALGGAPGLGKTMFGMATAKLLNRFLLILSLGEVQGSYVGESEANMRRVLNIAKAMSAVLLVDDVDKGGVSAATGAKQGGASEGGPFGRLINMLLTEMSSKATGIPPVFVFTFNRVQNVPGELTRKGRVDERFFVDYPDPVTRANIIKVHLAKRKFPAGEDAMINMLAGDYMDQWSGAEIEDLVHVAVIEALGRKSKVVDWKWAIEKAKTVKPMCEQEAYKEDIALMRNNLKDFVKVGALPEKEESAGSARANRKANI